MSKDATALLGKCTSVESMKLEHVPKEYAHF